MGKIVKVEHVDDFIGTQFPTPNGGTLTVTGWNGERNGVCAKKYTIECSICSKDVGLFLDGFKSFKGDLVKGSVPCGCAKNPRWSEEQYKIRVQRECKKRDYIFHGWGEDFKGKKTKLDLENPITGNKWSSTNINHFMQGKGDPKEGRLNTVKAKTLDYNTHIEDFIKAGFTEGHIFTRNTERVNTKGCSVHWNYTCPTCSNDQYVKVGVCSGIFTSYVGSLKSGKKSCRCSNTYFWTRDQREYQIKEVCHEEGLTFIGWNDEEVGYKNSYSRFKWVCSEGHDCKTSVNDFLNSDHRCMTCRIDKQKEQGILYGYYPSRTQENDSLYILNFDNKYIKVGRSFQVDVRINQLKKESGISNITTLHTVNGAHQEIYALEQLIHNNLRDKGFGYETNWGSIECFTIDSLDLVCKLISEEANNKSTIR